MRQVLWIVVNFKKTNFYGDITDVQNAISRRLVANYKSKRKFQNMPHIPALSFSSVLYQRRNVGKCGQVSKLQTYSRRSLAVSINCIKCFTDDRFDTVIGTRKMGQLSRGAANRKLAGSAGGLVTMKIY